MPARLPAEVRLELLPPAQAVAAFERRGLLQPAFSWQDVWQEEHARAFTVAKMMRTDLLATVYEEVGRAVREGRSFAEFESALTPTLQRAGWWGVRQVRDPATGELVQAQLGSPTRLQLIYDVNLRQSYAAGRWARIERQRRVNPLIVYRTMRDARVRALHRPWDGVALPVGHEWWNTHYPPNGWRCRCTAYGIDERGVQRLEDSGVPVKRRAPPSQMVQFTNRRTGEVVNVPRGIDPGFAYNPGKAGLAARATEQLTQKVAQLREPAPAIARELARQGPQLTTAQDYAQAGGAIADEHWQALGGYDPAKAGQWRERVLAQLHAERAFDTPAQLASRGRGAELVARASRMYPDEWTAAADRVGPLHVRGAEHTRGWAWTAQLIHAGRSVRLQQFGRITPQPGEGYLVVNTGVLGNAVHEYGHRLQSALPALDRIFQELHRARTGGQPLRRLSEITGRARAYAASEVAREDKYRSPYQGKEYYGTGAALEVLPMAFEDFMGHGASRLRELLEADREMAHLVIGLLRHWKP